MTKKISPRLEPRANTSNDSLNIGPTTESVNPDVGVAAITATLPPISFVAHYCAPPQEIPVELLPELLTGRVMYDLVLPLRRKYREVCGRLRAKAAKDAIREPKSHLPAVLPCGVFSVRRVAGLERYSGLVPVDFDGFESRREAERFKARLAQDAHVLLVFISPSGVGVKALLVLPTGYRHSYNWQMAACYCLKEFGRVADPTGKDVSRLTFVSYDAHPHWNRHAAELDWDWQAWARENESAFGKLGGAATRLNDEYVYADTEDNRAEAARRRSDELWSERQAPASLVRSAVAHLDQSVVSGYGDWLSIGMALHWWGQHSGLTEMARKLFHEASQKCPEKYRPSQVDIKWKSFDVSRRCLDDNCVTIGTLFHYALECGYEFPKRPKHPGRSLGRTRVPKGVTLGARAYR